jgi:hypothetical protein
MIMGRFDFGWRRWLDLSVLAILVLYAAWILTPVALPGERVSDSVAGMLRGGAVSGCGGYNQLPCPAQAGCSSNNYFAITGQGTRSLSGDIYCGGTDDAGNKICAICSKTTQRCITTTSPVPVPE